MTHQGQILMIMTEADVHTKQRETPNSPNTPGPATWDSLKVNHKGWARVWCLWEQDGSISWPIQQTAYWLPSIGPQIGTPPFSATVPKYDNLPTRFHRSPTPCSTLEANSVYMSLLLQRGKEVLKKVVLKIILILAEHVSKQLSLNASFFHLLNWSVLVR